MSAKSASKAGEQGTRPSADRYEASAAGASGNPGPTVWIRRNPQPEWRTSGQGCTEAADLDARHNPYIRWMASA